MSQRPTQTPVQVSPSRPPRRRISRNSQIGLAMILFIPLALMAIGWAMRGLPNLPRPKEKPGTLPDYHWTTEASLATARDDFGIATVGGKVYVFGGMTGDRGNKLDSTEVYDPATNHWSSGPALAVGRSSFRAAAIGDTIYLAGGATSEKSGINLVEAFDTTTSQFRQLAPLPTPRFGNGLVALNGKLYAVGGYSNGAATGSVEVYDPAANSWSAAAPLPTPRYNLAAVVLNDKIYALGGWVNDGPSTAVEVYDPATNAWSAGTPMKVPMSNFGATVLDGRIYTLLHQVQQIYDPSVDKWLGSDPMPTTRHGEGVVAVGENLYAIGGCYEDPQYDLDTVEAFVPGPAPDAPLQATGRDRFGSIAVIFGALLTAVLVATALYFGRHRPAFNQDFPDDGDGEDGSKV
ncbi:MAG: Kelch repeat-containing protein [Thermomicrobiales bacterium]